MRMLSNVMFGIGLSTLLVGGVARVSGQELRNEGQREAHVTISAETKREVTLDPTLIKVEVNGHRTALVGLQRIQPSEAQVAILIDDGLRASFGNELGDLRKFVATLPEGTQVVVGYMRNGGVTAPGGFSTDHDAVAKTIRMPVSAVGVSASPYFCLAEFAKRWPASDRGARFVLMLTNGVDPYNGSVSPTNQNSPYVEAAVEDAQRAGIAVYAIAYGDAGMRGEEVSNSGQGYLNQVADGTGGRNLWGGIGSPVSIQPFLKQFRSAIAESYKASFETRGRGEHGLSRLKISTSQPGVKLHAPEAVLGRLE